MFWVDAEDHDWDEIASCTVLDPSFQPRTITLPKPEGAGERSVAALRLDARVEHSLDELAAALGETEFTDDAAWPRFAPRIGPASAMADAFARWLETLLGPHGLVVFDSSDPAAKPLVADLFARELGAPGPHGDAGRRRLATRSPPAGTSRRSFRSPTAWRSSTRRRAAGPSAGRAKTSSPATNTFTVETLVEAGAGRAPHRFSPNVLLRPLVQDTLFPTICYVAGPSELAYLGQLREVYNSFGVPMPLMYPRATATLVDSATARFLASYDVPIEELQQQDESALNRLLESQIPQSVEQAIADAEAAMRRSMERVIEAMPAVDPTLAGAAKTTLVEDGARICGGCRTR